MKKSVLAFPLVSILALVSQAEEPVAKEPYNFGIALASPLQRPEASDDIEGFRFGGFFGVNRNVTGFDLGFAEVCSFESVGSFKGAQLSAISWTESNFTGFQLAAFANIVKGSTDAMQMAFANAVWEDCRGFQLGIVNYTVGLKGCQLGLVNWNDLASYGWDIGLVNANQMEFSGCALGVLNYAESHRGLAVGLVNCAYDVNGCQIGLVNACDHMHGVQFGLVNMICGSPLPIMVIANAWF